MMTTFYDEPTLAELLGGTQLGGGSPIKPTWGDEYTDPETTGAHIATDEIAYQLDRIERAIAEITARADSYTAPIPAPAPKPTEPAWVTGDRSRDWLTT